ncbi:MAG TPA: ankyrin repeat domain-containing protein [Allosphingosinicella sp.]|jgi:ankyrin repeat protein
MSKADRLEPDAFEILRTGGVGVLLRRPRFDLSVLGRRGQSLLQEAISRRDTEGALKLIEAGVDLDNQDSDGRTALHYAAIFANLRVAEQICLSGGNPNRVDRHGNNALWSACIEDHEPYAMVKLLVRYGADPDQVNKVGRSPVGFAKLTGNELLAAALEPVA